MHFFINKKSILNANCQNSTAVLETIIKKEKLREEILVSDSAEIGSLKLEEYINLEIIKYLFPLAEGYGPVDKDVFAVPVYKEQSIIGYVFETYDITRGLGYSRRPFHILVGLRIDGIISKVKLVKHVEPIGILGRTDEDFHKYLEQFEGIDISRGVSLTLNLTGADIEGSKIAMRSTAGETKNLTKIDGVSRTTTSSLLFMDAILRGARKIARQKNIDLKDKDLGNILDLEVYNAQKWNSLLKDKSLSSKKIIVKDINAKFKELYKVKSPREIRFINDEKEYSQLFLAVVSPSGIGINILGRRWYDQYVSAGRNVEDIVVFFGVNGKNWRDVTGKKNLNTPYKNIHIEQGGNKILLTPKMYKSLPFNHSKNGVELNEQGLFFFSNKDKLNPALPFTLIYSIDGIADSEIGKDNNRIYFKLDYLIPNKYILKDIINEKFNWKPIWGEERSKVIISILTLLIAILIMSFSKSISKHRKTHNFLRVIFLTWTFLWLGWYVGGQISIIHLINILQWSIFGGDVNMFLVEPVIVVIALGSIMSLFLWGRAIFCGWLCPFGALQELLFKLARIHNLKKIKISSSYDYYLRKIKYVILFTIIITSIIDYNVAAKMTIIEPFKAAITLRFIAPATILFWVFTLLFVCLFIERAYCRYFCSLGASFALLGRLRLKNYLLRRKECGSPCKACNSECPTGAIKKDGEIQMSECFGCLDCQVMYYDKNRCPALVSLKK